MTDALAPTIGIRFSDAQKIDWLRLFRSENVGPATFLDLINHYGTAAAALDALPGLAGRASRKPIRIASRADAEQELERLHRMKAQLVCLGEPDYPAALRAADGPPPVLAVAGDIGILRRKMVAFVGSRNASLSGVKMTKQLSAGVAKAGYVTVSGLARGIDAAAHQATVETGTIAVFAGGVNHIYPPENETLAKEIVGKGGALVSEMPFGWKPRAQDFPRRNRIVAGMSLATVVVEAAKRSGSLISARLANEMGRLVFAVPGSPLDPRSEGANHLIRQGATLARSAEDILEGVEPISQIGDQSGYSLEESETDTPDLEEAQKGDREKLLSALSHAPTHLDELLRFTGLPAGVMQLLVLELALAGTIERHSGNRISLV